MPEAPAGGEGSRDPRCPGCRASLLRVMRATSTPVPMDETGDWIGPVAVLYCGACGLSLGVLPPTGGRPPEGDGGRRAEAGEPRAGDAALGGHDQEGDAPEDELRPGQRVRVVSGPLAGRDGVVRAVEEDQGTLLVQLGGFGYGRRLRVDPDAVRPL